MKRVPYLGSLIAGLAFLAFAVPAAARMEHGGIINAATFSPDGKKALSAGFDEVIKLWDIATGVEIAP